jgi:hypothetical protein
LPADDGLSAKGMVIYNSNASLSGGAGLYAWNGSEWKSMSAGNANSCIPVTAAATSGKTGNNAKITVNVTAGNPTFSYIWTKDGIPVRTTANVSAASDTYTTAGEGIYTVTVTNPCTATPISFTFEVSDTGETLVDNGNGTKTDSQGNLVYKGETYAPVESDVPGIYLKDGEIVYTGADGIPDTDDDNVFVVPDYPLPKQETLFSRIYPVMIHQDGIYQMQLDFADGRTYPGTYNGKIKFISNNPSVITISETGVMTAGSTSDGVSTTYVVILEDGSIYTLSPSVLSNIIGSGNKLAGVTNAEATLAEGSIAKIGVSLRATDGSGNAYNTTTLTYAIKDDGDPKGTGSTVTPGGWFHAGNPGVVTVTATATDDEENKFTGTIIVTVLGEPSEEIDYEAASTHWATLEPAPAYAGGDGTKDKPYQISSVRQFKKLAVDIALLGSTNATYQKYFELTTDLDFSEDNTVKSSVIGTFYGTFDGKGHVIKDLNIDATGKSNISLFSALSYGEIKNLGREGGSTTGNDASYVSGLVLTVGSNGKLSNCYNSSSINILRVSGGLVENMSNGSIIQNCYNTGEIIASGEINGGLVAICLYRGGRITIINCYNAGNVSGSYSNGGIIGYFNGSGGNKQILNLNNSFNFGSIANTINNNSAGSLIGRINETNSDLVEVNATNVYSRPDVVSINNGAISKPNQPIGWNNSERENLKDAILLANSTMGENAKYSLEYSKLPAFAAELGDAFKHAPGRTPKLAWEK